MRSAKLLFVSLMSFVMAACGGDYPAAFPNAVLFDAGIEQQKSDDLAHDMVAKYRARAQFANFVAVNTRRTSTPMATLNGLSVGSDEVAFCLDYNVINYQSLQPDIDCDALLDNLTVELIASTEQGGVLTYYFNRQPVLRLGFTNETSSIKKLSINGSSARFIDNTYLNERNDASSTRWL